MLSADTRKALAGRHYRCAADDLYWAATEGPACWFCGHPGTLASAPQLNSQHGFDRDTERDLLSRPGRAA